jgi:hypothetical protein
MQTWVMAWVVRPCGRVVVWHETRHALSLRAIVFKLEFVGILTKMNETLVETRHALSRVTFMRLTNAKPYTK